MISKGLLDWIDRNHPFRSSIPAKGERAMKRKPLVKVSSERRRESEARAVVMEFEAIVRTANVLPLTAVQVDRVKEMSRMGFKRELMLLASWMKFVKAHSDFILLSPEARAMLGQEESIVLMDQVQHTVNRMKDLRDNRMRRDRKAAACPLQKGGVL